MEALRRHFTYRGFSIVEVKWLFAQRACGFMDAAAAVRVAGCSCGREQRGL